MEIDWSKPIRLIDGKKLTLISSQMWMGKYYHIVENVDTRIVGLYKSDGSYSWQQSGAPVVENVPQHPLEEVCAWLGRQGSSQGVRHYLTLQRYIKEHPIDE